MRGVLLAPQSEQGGWWNRLINTYWQGHIRKRSHHLPLSGWWIIQSSPSEPGISGSPELRTSREGESMKGLIVRLDWVLQVIPLSWSERAWREWGYGKAWKDCFFRRWPVGFRAITKSQQETFKDSWLSGEVWCSGQAPGTCLALLLMKWMSAFVSSPCRKIPEERIGQTLGCVPHSLII